MEQQARRSQERIQVVKEGLEQVLKVEEAKSKLAIYQITTPTASFEAQA